MKLPFSAMLFTGAVALAQVPPDIEAGLIKIGQIVDPACTAKLYRPLMPKNDYNSNVTPLYPGVTIARDVSFGPHRKDLIDIFTPDKGAGNRPVFIYVPGGAGNKIEQQDREANAFYDNIGRWATENGMVGVTMQRHPGQKLGRSGQGRLDPFIGSALASSPSAVTNVIPLLRLSINDLLQAPGDPLPHSIIDKGANP